MRRTKHKKAAVFKPASTNKLTDLTGLETPVGNLNRIEVSGRISQKGLTPNSAATDNMKECCMW